MLQEYQGIFVENISTLTKLFKNKVIILAFILVQWGLLQVCNGADLAISIPVSDFQDPNGMYRLDYSPPVGYPKPNTTFLAADISNTISFSNGLPGTKYSFQLHYTNDTIHDWLTWTASITTTPDPPSNLTINVRNGKTVQLAWNYPERGGYTKFKLSLIPLSELGQQGQPRNFSEEKPSFTLRDLVPGASYKIQLYTMYENKESLAYISANFTTKPNTPGRFIVWYRNETTLLVLWQPPYPAGIFTHYKVQIEPQDAIDSVLYLSKEGEPPGPAQAAFNNLVPGRAYNISVETVSEDQISAPTTAQYRTVPLRPGNITFDPDFLTPYRFRVTWLPPAGPSEFDRYQIQNQGEGTKKWTPLTIQRDAVPQAVFDKNLEPGRTYNVVVKTLSGKVASWPSTANVTTRPLPVVDVQNKTDFSNGDILITWSPHADSTQDHYKVTSQEVEAFGGDVNSIIVNESHFLMSSLLPGRNYSISIQSVSNGIDSEEVTVYQATRPSSPIVQDLHAINKGLNISWKSDVTSRQDMYLIEYTRNDTGENFNKTTGEGQLQVIIQDLFPGAAYNIQLYAVSHRLLSEKHTYFQAVFPNPPRNLTALKVSNSSIFVRWLPPVKSLYSGYVVRYRTDDNGTWNEFHVADTVTEKEITDLSPGERYIIRVNSVSYRVEAANFQQIIQTVRPSGVSDVRPDVDASNITLQWSKPPGRIESYYVEWDAIDPIPIQDPDNEDSESAGSHAQLLHGEKLVEQEFWEDTIRIPISPLMSGVAYTVKVSTTSHGMNGENYNITIRTLPLITSEVLIVNTNNNNTRSEVTLKFTATPSSISLFDRYRFELSDPSIPAKEIAADNLDRKVTFTGLVPGRLYNFTVWTVSKDVRSRALQRQDRLYPEAITTINATHISDREISLEWDKPRGDYDQFEVQYLNADDRFVENLTLHPSIVISGLKPFRNYTFTVVVRSGSDSTILRRSDGRSAVFRTKESVPAEVTHFKVTDIQPKNITFEWVLPESEHNGILTSFVITYGAKDHPMNYSRRFSARETQGTITGLSPGVTYIFGIQAQTKIGPGNKKMHTARMPIWAPPKPAPGVFPNEVSKTSTTMKIRFRKNYFSNKNGEVVKYAVIVAEAYDKDSSGLELRSWADVQSYNRWPPYQVSEPMFYFTESDVKELEIGADRSCTTKEAKKGVYCNGPLRAGTTYRVKIRAFTDTDKYTDTDYSAPIVTDQDNTLIILSVSICVASMAVIVICVIFVKRRCHGGMCSKDPKPDIDVASIPESMIETSRPVKLKDFTEHYRLMSADSDFRFSEEFEELKRVGRDQLCSAADLPVNRPKNRFTNILPYDQSRFKLQPTDDDEGSDYINANYVTGLNSPREFIVTQGPLASTRDDFWRMCWESNSRAVVMLTRCVEKGREKCDRYWPCDTLPQYYGDIQVQILNESRYPDWNVSEFRLQRGDQFRLIKHFHFTTWPDFGVPDPPQTLVRFVRAFRDRVPPEQDRVRPIVVHCSAGVGRSGTFIALDRILQQIKRSDIVDIFGIVYNMRKERVWMVQTEQQYICVHQCLLVVLDGKENDIPSPREIHSNDGYEDDEGIAESGM
ncbi:unnamed protein product [Allacma fusca]|uniref:protein-tyrosine-phosphatase n=1 Tax=Allacma fusca TaxID=39272 RepID=A0A8J2K194_9HEXA|nr:unnamed protein product [Allacma fusca]